MSKVLACIDGSYYGASVCDHAAWIANLLGADVELLHALDRAADAVQSDLSGSIGLGGSDELLEKLTQLDEDRAHLRMERGKAILQAAADRIGAAGVATVTTRLRHGGLVDTVHEVEGDARLVVLGKRGEHADFAKMHLGGSVEQVIRASALPVLVASRAFRPIRRVLVAYDGSDSADRGLDFILAQARSPDMELHVIMAGHPRHGDVSLARVRARVQDWPGSVTVDHRPGDPETVIGDHVRTAGIDLLVMGAYGTSPIRRFVVGSTTTALIRTCQVPALLFRV